jgi:L-iditol 2-dehydrogenase
MLSAVIVSGGVAIRELPTPVLSQGEILVATEFCGLCGTDLEKLAGEYTASAPIIGHEVVGTVVEVNSPNKDIKVGDRIFPHHHVPCYSCWKCKHGSTTMCDHYRKTNIFPGGFSELFRVPSWNIEHGGVLKLPQNLNFERASFIEPLGCVVRSIRKCSLAGDEKVTIIGAGPMGLLHGLMLDSSTKCSIRFLDTSEYRRSFCEELGFNAENPLTNRVQTGEGSDLVIVAAGNPSAISRGFEEVRQGGKVCLFGVPHMSAQLSNKAADLLNNEISVITSYAADDQDTGQALELISSRKVNVEKLVTHIYTLQQLNDAIAAAKSTNSMKILVTPCAQPSKPN